MTAPVWLRLTDTSGRGVLLRAECVRAVYDVGNRRRVEYGSGPDDHIILTDTLDDIAAALGVGAPAPAAALPLSDADEAVACGACGGGGFVGPTHEVPCPDCDEDSASWGGA